jgi:16S rRNA (uracil1498-N3)-methyltransferase
MHRFFAIGAPSNTGRIIIKGQDAAHIRVLRIRPEETVVVCDGRGLDYICRLIRADGREAELEIINTEPSSAEPSVDCTVYAAFPKADKAESIIQKCVELGAAAIYFFPSERCVSRPDQSSVKKKEERWSKISEEAAKQSGRGVIPKTGVIDSFDKAVKQAADADLPLFLYEKETELSIASPLLKKGPSCKTVSVMTGAEGGFEPFEADKARQAGMLLVSMGKRILRCETAPVAALSAVMLCTENF